MDKGRVSPFEEIINSEFLIYAYIVIDEKLD